MTDDRLHIYALGHPVAQGSMRAPTAGVVVHSGGVALANWRADIIRAAAHAKTQKKHPGYPNGPVSIAVTFTLKRPQTAPRSRTLPHVRPDLDKLLRAVLDALTTACVWRDDSQVVSVRCRKLYAESGQPTGAYIIVGAAVSA